MKIVDSGPITLGANTQLEVMAELVNQFMAYLIKTCGGDINCMKSIATNVWKES